MLLFSSLILSPMPTLSFAATTTSATDIYLANSAQGTGDASSCANAKVWTFFNSAGNWGSGSTQIGPGTTVHLCGTITGSAGSSMTFQGSGSVGNPVTVKFESGAVMQSTAWGQGQGEGACPCAGAFTISGVHDVVVDGGGTPNTGNNPAGLAVQNGVIKNTGDGGIGVYIHQSTDVTVKNLVIGPIYTASTFARAVTNIVVDGGTTGNSNVVLQNNILPTAGTGVGVEGAEGTGTIPVHIYRNLINGNHCWKISEVNGGTNSIVLIDGNEFINWSTDNGCHTDGLFSNNGYAYIYNNYFHGNIMVGGSPTGYFYCTYPSTASGFNSSCRVFNNIFESMTGVINGGNGGPDKFYNNTNISASAIIFYMDQGSGSSVSAQNNIAIASGTPSNLSPNSTQIYAPQYGGSGSNFFVANGSDYNDYYGFSLNGWWAGTTTLVSWLSQGFDTHSLTSNPNLSSSFPYTLLSGSPALRAGANLTSVCNADQYMAPLCKDRLGNARPTTGAWDMGATQVSQVSQTAPNAPTSLTASVN